MSENAFTAIDVFAESAGIESLGRQLGAIREAAPAFREWFGARGRVRAVATFDLVGLPYPTQYALFRAHSAICSPYVRITNRMLVVQFDDPSGRLRTMLVGPTDVDLAANTAYFDSVRARFPGPLADSLVARHPSVPEHLAAIGLRPEDVDYITYDHLHTQDLRRWLGTVSPQPDLAAIGLAPPDEPVQPVFPNAKLLIARREWEQFPAVHPLQRRWFQSGTHAAVRTDNIVLLDGDTWLGEGVALLSTPGHTVGNVSIVLNTSSGIWTSSENGMMPDAYDPGASLIPGMRSYARETGLEVVLNSNTPESSAQQYNSMIKEKLIADRGGPGGEHVQHFSSSEMTPWVLARRTGPGYVHGAISDGALDLSRRRPARRPIRTRTGGTERGSTTSSG